MIHNYLKSKTLGDLNKTESHARDLINQSDYLIIQMEKCLEDLKFYQSALNEIDGTPIKENPIEIEIYKSIKKSRERELITEI